VIERYRSDKISAQPGRDRTYKTYVTLGSPGACPGASQIPSRCEPALGSIDYRSLITDWS